MDSSKSLVLDGTGKTGRRVVQRPVDRGLPVRVGSRQGRPPFEWQDPAGGSAALEGARSVYVSYLLRDSFVEVLDGRNARLGDGGARGLGRAPRDFADYAREAAAAGAWKLEA